MAFNFPNNPIDGQIFTPALGGPSYVWVAADGVWISLEMPAVEDAPSDGNTYGRRNQVWTVVVTEVDFIAAIDAVNVNWQAADALKANIASPTFTGDPKAPTPAPGDNDTSLATTAYVTAAIAAASGASGFVPEAPNDGGLYARQSLVWNNLTDEFAAKAPLASPALTGTPTAPTASPGDNDTSIATTAFVTAAVAAAGSMIETLYTAGSTLWTKPAGLKFLEVEGSAAGGGGSAAIVTGAGIYSLGAGGGAGAWGRKLFAAADLPASLTISIGSPGAASAGAGLAGGAATFGGLITLPGGTGGFQGANTTGAGSALTAASSGPSGVTFGAGGPGSSYTQVNYGGISMVGCSGSNMFGGPSPSYVTAASGGSAGIAGSGYGSGGGGAVNGPNASVRTGAGGQQGFFRVKEYY